MLSLHLLLVLLAFGSATAFWPFSENSDTENDDSADQELTLLTKKEDDGRSSDTSDYFNQCLDFYKCDVCYEIKEKGKCLNHKSECRKTCTGCEGPDSDRYGTEKCQYYKSKGYCAYLSFKSFKCQKTCGSCEVNGNWGEWSGWNTCSKTCKQGKQSRKRECNSPAPQYGGEKCEGDSNEQQVCNENVPCPVDGNWGVWSKWSTCSKTCKQGKQSRKRECNSPAPQYGGNKCDGYASQVQDCNKDVPCPVDGNWGEWSEWSTCSKTCRQGKQSRKRECDSPAPQYGGKKCDGQSSETQDCNKNVPCPVDGNWGEWSEWSTCSKTCKQGKQSRKRECNSPAPQYGGEECDGYANQIQVCNENVPCPVDGNWGEWGEWSACSKTCKQGKQSRKRECNSPAPQYGGKKCEGDSSEDQICNENVPCPVNGNWGKWSEWSTCSKMCKQGKQSRKRECNSPAPQYGGKKCEGDSSEDQVCNENVPCPVNGNWGEWSEWSSCSKTCKQGKQSRKRECNSPAPQYGGNKCEGDSSEDQVCNEKVPCPVNGNWGEWSEWSTCSKTCKQGKQSRKRECDSPAPQYGGKKCEGDSNEHQVCNENVPCPVNGNWGEWSEWSSCSKTCKQGKQSRKRECNSPAPQYGGNKCDGDSSEDQVCNENVPCPVNGNWGEWSEWSTCSKTCKQGKQSRKRECDSPAPQYGGKKCEGDSNEHQVCNENVPCPVNGNWGEWSEWSTCSKTCKQGKQSRKRECNSPAPLYGGKKCDGDSSEDQVCNENVPCPVNGNWGEWSEWSTCSKTCKQGKQSRKRECDSPAPQYGGNNCEGDSSEDQVCNENVPCPVNGNWGEWSEWSTCSKTCKQGKQSRKRECNSPAPQYGGQKCEGDSNEHQVCNENVHCPVDGNWGEWSEWSVCSKTCKQGKQSRTRKCNSPAARYGGKKCDGESDEIQPCNEDVPCPVDGNWGEWSEWSTCSKTCKQGKQLRKRECNSPAPQYGGNKCEGDSNEDQVCNENVHCPVDGNWGEWGAWGTCSKTCGGGEHARTRQCDSPAPAYGGKQCEGPFRQRRLCNKEECPVDGSWGEWSEWSICSKTCKQGQKSRTRECNAPAPLYGGKSCEGNSIHTLACNENVPCPVDGMWSSWTPWTACSKTCGYGKRERKRFCDNPKPAYNGKACLGIGYQKRRCHAYYPCPINGNWTSWGAWSQCTKTCGSSYRKRARSCTNPPQQYGGIGCDGSNDQVERCVGDACPVPVY